jgi:hypothetical protein
MFDIFYGGRPNRPLNRGAGGGNLVFTCACGNCDSTVQVFASNIREAQRRCARRGEAVGCNCTSMPPVQTGIRR